MLSSADMVTDTHVISVVQPGCWHLKTLAITIQNMNYLL